MTLFARFTRHLDESRLLADDERLLVAVSGGLDSVVLLHLLRFGGHAHRIEVAHFDHRMRAGSAADAHWVRGLCHAWSLPLHQATADTTLRSEAEARAARYRFLNAAARVAGASVILTAHHADDQAETLLFRLARGTGLRGLAGIPERRGNIARPLLPFARTELLAHARAAGLGWREDPTNTDMRFARNRIRHAVLPAMEAVRPGAARRIARLAAHAAEAESAWQQVTERLLDELVTARSDSAVELARDRLLGYHPHVRARVIRDLLRRLDAVPDRAGTRAVLAFISAGESGGSMAVAGGVRVEREFGVVRIRQQDPRPERAAGTDPDCLVIPSAGAGAGTVRLDDRLCTVRWSLAAQDPGGGEYAEFDPSALRFPLALRGWRPGDRIRLPYGSKKLKKLFLERRVRRSFRGGVPVLVDAAGSVVWVAGVARSILAPEPDEQRIFSITVLDGEPF